MKYDWRSTAGVSNGRTRMGTKPELHLRNLTGKTPEEVVDQLMVLFKRLTGKEPTADKRAELVARYKYGQRRADVGADRM